MVPPISAKWWFYFVTCTCCWAFVVQFKCTIKSLYIWCILHFICLWEFIEMVWLLWKLQRQWHCEVIWFGMMIIQDCQYDKHYSMHFVYDWQHSLHVLSCFSSVLRHVVHAVSYLIISVYSFSVLHLQCITIYWSLATYIYR